ncbi:MAG: IS3 family transposase [Acidobacteriaceae bacterium]|nr:IS3 family transposase [Acidobacteriaceae bacterium]MDE1161045.1 IS3 family transposase [Acidobacteriaceae bacterium]MDE1162348.1 IS3 family transposase [Acidobacteriaceae bacterium]
MARKRHTAEQVVNLLRQVEVGIANGKTTVLACKEALITEQTYYRWRKEYGGLQVDQAKRLKELEQENSKLKRLVANLSLEKLVLKDIAGGKLLSPERRRCAVDHAQQKGMSERWACRVVKQPRGTQRYRPTQREDEDQLTQAIVVLAGQYGRYGYRRITALLVHAGWKVGKDRVERIWRREGLKVPKKQKPRGRLWLNDGSCVRLRPMHRNHVWSYDFVSVRTHDGRTARTLNLIDEHTREALIVKVERRWSSAKVIEALADVMVSKGVPEHLRSDNGPEFVAHDLRTWLAKTGAKTMYIEPGSPWENGYCESFNSKMRDEFLNGEIFYSLKELRVLAERWRRHYNTARPHSSLGYRPPAPEAWLASTVRRQEEPVASLPAPLTALSCIDLNSEIVALH